MTDIQRLEKAFDSVVTDLGLGIEWTDKSSDEGSYKDAAEAWLEDGDPGALTDDDVAEYNRIIYDGLYRKQRDDVHQQEIDDRIDALVDHVASASIG